MRWDNAGTIAFAHNQSITQRDKHVDVKHHYVRDATKRSIVSQVHCPTVEMPADILTKPLARILFQKGVHSWDLYLLHDPKACYPGGALEIFGHMLDHGLQSWTAITRVNCPNHKFSLHHSKHVCSSTCARGIILHGCTLRSILSMFHF